MAGASVEVDFTSRLKELKISSEEAFEMALEMCGITAEGYAKMKCPVDTGRLRNSITHAVVEENGEKAVYIGTNVEYAPYVELGTKNTDAQPFLEPAATGHTAVYKGIIESVLRGK